VALELEVGHFRFSRAFSGVDRAWNTPDAPLDQFAVAREVAVVPIVAAVRLSGRWGPVELYGLAGAGLYLASVDGVGTSSLYGPSSFHWTDRPLGLHAGAGVVFPMASGFALGLEARYTHAKARFEPGPSPSTVQTVGPYEIALDSAIVTAGVGYAF